MGKATKRKIAGIYDPYLDTLGGGERYVMTLTECLLKNGWKVDIFWDDFLIKEKIKKRLNLKIEEANFVPNIFKKSLIKKFLTLKKYDLLFYLSDGSIPWLFGKKNILHFQVPFHHIGGKNFVNQLKLKNIDAVVCNSYFTKKFIDKEFGIKSKVVYPPVAVEEFKPQKKENIILAVGRFSQLLQAKRQDVLIDVFKKMVDEGFSGWKLILAGATDVGGKDYFNQLKRQVGSYPIELWENPDFQRLKNLYGRAKIFWSASGFGVDEEKEPERVEHFGITTIEAMAAGVVPIVVKKGEAPRIIKEGEEGFLWEKKEELAKLTLDLVNNPEKLQKLSVKVIKSSQNFSKKKFWEKFYEIIEKNN